LAKKSYGAQRALAQNAALRKMREDELSSARGSDAPGKMKK